MAEMLTKSVKVSSQRDETPQRSEMIDKLSQIVEIKEMDSQTGTKRETPENKLLDDEPKATGFSKTMKANQDIGQLRFKNLLQTQEFVLDTCISFVTNLLQIKPE